MMDSGHRLDVYVPNKTCRQRYANQGRQGGRKDRGQSGPTPEKASLIL